MHRRLQEGLLTVHGSIEDFYRTRATLIPVTVGSFAARQKLEGSKMTTITRMATPRGPIPVTAGTFEAYHWGGVGGWGGGIPLRMGGGGGWERRAQDHTSTTMS